MNYSICCKYAETIIPWAQSRNSYIWLNPYTSRAFPTGKIMYMLLTPSYICYWTVTQMSSWEIWMWWDELTGGNLREYKEARIFWTASKCYTFLWNITPLWQVYINFQVYSNIAITKSDTRITFNFRVCFSVIHWYMCCSYQFNKQGNETNSSQFSLKGLPRNKNKFYYFWYWVTGI